jgi:hypothetical protein
MKRQESYVRDTLVNVQQFLDANAAALGPVNQSGARKALDDAIVALGDHAVAQGEHTIRSAGETNKQRSLRLSLRKQYLRPIAKIAAASLANVPEISALRLPSANLVGSELVDKANAMANAAEPHAAVFIAAGLRADFLDGLRAMAKAMETSLGGRTDHVIKRRGSTIALGSGAVSGRTALRLLDAVIAQQVPDNAQLLAEWQAVKRIPRKSGTTRGAEKQGAAAAAAASTATAAPATPSAATATPATPAPAAPTPHVANAEPVAA